jgi:protein AroM
LAAVLGLVTIGQTPRPDFESEFHKFAPGAEIRIFGALDDITHEELSRLARRKGDYPLYTRLADGTTVDIPLAALVPLVSQQAQRLANEGARLVVILCAGAFPEFECSAPLLLPGKIVPAVVGAVSKKGIIGIVTPIADQVSAAQSKWEADGFDVKVTWASPFRHDEIYRAAQEMSNPELEMVVLDCMGHNPDYQREFIRLCGRPVILAQSLVARVAAELLGL